MVNELHLNCNIYLYGLVSSIFECHSILKRVVDVVELRLEFMIAIGFSKFLELRTLHESWIYKNINHWNSLASRDNINVTMYGRLASKSKRSQEQVTDDCF